MIEKCASCGSKAMVHGRFTANCPNAVCAFNGVRWDVPTWNEINKAVREKRERERENKESPRQESCLWEIDEDGCFETGCDEKHMFIEGGIQDNRYKFCPYCGGEIMEAK